MKYFFKKGNKMTSYDDIVPILKELAGAKTIKELADKLGISPRNFNTWKTRGEIPLKTLMALSHAIGITKEQMMSAIKNGVNHADEIQIHQNGVGEDYSIKKITAYKASAGGGNEIDDIKAYETGELMPIAKAFFKTPPKKELNAIEISGESMMPMLHDGDWVIFCDDGEFRGDGLYVVNFSGQLMAKALQLSPKGELKIISVNPNFASYEIDINETQEHFRIIGKVIKSIV